MIAGKHKAFPLRPARNDLRTARGTVGVERLSDEQLKHIQENRNKRVNRRSPRPVGQIAAEFLASGILAGPAWKRELIGLLEERTGGELLSHASIVGVRNGVLNLHVAEPALMYSLRLNWEQRLLNLLRTELPGAGVHTVRFTSGGNRD